MTFQSHGKCIWRKFRFGFLDRQTEAFYPRSSLAGGKPAPGTSELSHAGLESQSDIFNLSIFAANHLIFREPERERAMNGSPRKAGVVS
jgi:hypothetical protein